MMLHFFFRNLFSWGVLDCICESVEHKGLDGGPLKMAQKLASSVVGRLRKYLKLLERTCKIDKQEGT